MAMSTGPRRGGVCADINLRTQPGLQASRNP